jgi:hypothetical protein
MITRVRRAGITHILFDFFGTLVDYSASRVEQEFEGVPSTLAALGVELTYEDFLDAWSLASAEFDQRSDRDDHESPCPGVPGTPRQRRAPEEEPAKPSPPGAGQGHHRRPVQVGNAN